MQIRIRRVVNKRSYVLKIVSSLLLISFSYRIDAQPSVATFSQIKNCHYLNQVRGDSGYGKNFNWQALAKYSAQHQAEKMDATHIVWVKFEWETSFNGSVVAYAYKCSTIVRD